MSHTTYRTFSSNVISFYEEYYVKGKTTIVESASSAHGACLYSIKDLTVISFCEGDVCYKTFDSVVSVGEEVMRVIDWHENNNR